MAISGGPPLDLVREDLMLAKDCSYRTSALQKSSDDTMPRSHASYCLAATPCGDPSHDVSIEGGYIEGGGIEGGYIEGGIQGGGIQGGGIQGGGYTEGGIQGGGIEGGYVEGGIEGGGIEGGLISSDAQLVFDETLCLMSAYLVGECQRA